MREQDAAQLSQLVITPEDGLTVLERPRPRVGVVCGAGHGRPFSLAHCERFSHASASCRRKVAVLPQ